MFNKGFGNDIKSGLLSKPIGLASKSYETMRDTLFRKIGSGYHIGDGYGTPIGEMMEQDLNDNRPLPWFYVDKKKNSTSNYIDYVNNSFFNGFGSLENNFITAEEKIRFFNYNSLRPEYNQVGAVRGYNIKNNLTSLMFDDGQTNPNSYIDTRLGLINGFYLNATLNNARNIYEKIQEGPLINDVLSRLQSSLTGEDGTIVTEKRNISKYVYTRFGFDGDFGMRNIENHMVNGRVLTQEELIGDAMPYGDFSTYGDYNTITNNSKLLEYTSDETRLNVLNSIYGYDLLNKGVFNPSEDGENVYAPKKYYATTNNNVRKTYIDNIVGAVGKLDLFEEDNFVRYKLLNVGQPNKYNSRTLYSYAEADRNGNDGAPSDDLNSPLTSNLGVEVGSYVAYTSSTTNDIIGKTNSLFHKGKVDTLIARFHTRDIGDPQDSRDYKSISESAVSRYGLSHGRNLLRKDHETNKENGYHNPYCRVWTYHHQYSKLGDTIRPFDTNDGLSLENTDLVAYRTKDGLKKLSIYGSKGKNGLVKIAPSSKDDITKCMFSIENLAWKGEKNFFKGHEDQLGPLGGRIMWFPPYGLSFSDTSSVNWNTNSFIGRGENIYTYVNTERSGSLSFKLLIDHPSIVNSWRGNVEGGNGNGDVDDVNSNEQQLLRFFAGCDILEGKKTETKIKEEPPKVTPKPKKVVTQRTRYDEIAFFVFYPNNYSGADDPADYSKSPISAMEYLANGIGAGYYCSDNGIDNYSVSSTNAARGYEIGSEGITPQDKYGNNKCDSKSIGSFNGVTLVAQKHTSKRNNSNGYRYWGYRVDERVADETLYSVSGNVDYNYFDTTSYQLNSTGYNKLIEQHTDFKELYEKGKLYSFADVFHALNNTDFSSAINGKYNDKKSKIIKELITTYDIADVEINGYASSHGYNDSNIRLSKDRGRSILKWLSVCYPDKFSTDMCNVGVSMIAPQLNDHDSRQFLSKVWRCASVRIKLSKDEYIESFENTDISNQSVNNNNISNETYTNPKFEHSVKKQNHSVKDASVESNSKKNENDAEKDIYGKPYDNMLNDIPKNGYSDEFKFFNELKTEEPFLHSKIVEKLKYFDPAFHSITPEGFQSRLTFLQQCTRQGNTYANSDLNNSARTANNLSFGKPPVCVLRIGDFYYTKIIIESLNYDFNDTTWDLNDEGIGIMPMMCDVTINFKFIGGSDLSGPITRLQNALSFNYYSNTIVYDDRAEEITYENGEIKDFKPKY